MALTPYEGHDLEALRDILTREMLAQSRRLSRFSLRCPLEFLDREILDDAAITHWGGYEGAWGSRVYERRHVDIDSITDTPGDLSQALTMRFRDVRGSLLRTEWDPSVVDAWSDQLAIGRARALSGPANFFRSGTTSVEVGVASLIEPYRPQVPPVTHKGILVERLARAWIQASALNTALGSPWVSGGGTTVDTSVLFWTPATSAQHYMVTGATASEQWFDQTFTPTSAVGDIFVVSADHMDIDGVASSFKLFNVTATKWWRASDDTWQSFSVWNPFTLSGASTPRRDSYFATVAVASQQYRYILGYDAGAGNNGKRSRFFYANVETGRSGAGPANANQKWASSRIATPLAAGIRPPSQYIVGNYAGARTWPATQGTYLATIETLWSSANQSGLGLTFELHRVWYDANNYISIFYDGNNARWTFRRRHAGVNTDLNFSGSVVAGTPPKIALRWSSNANGELNDLYGTPSGSNAWFDAIIDGVKSSGQQSVQPAESADSWLYVGGTEGQQIDAYVKYEIVPYVLSETEVARWAA